MNPIYHENKPFIYNHFGTDISYEKGICPVAERLYEKELMLTAVCRPPATREDMDDIVTASGIERERLGTFVFQAIDKLEQPLALNDVPGIGEKTAERLKHMGIQTANQLARMNSNIKVEGISKERLKSFIDNAWELILKT